MRKNMTQIYEANLMMVRHRVQRKWGVGRGGGGERRYLNVRIIVTLSRKDKML